MTFSRFYVSVLSLLLFAHLVVAMRLDSTYLENRNKRHIEARQAESAAAATTEGISDSPTNFNRLWSATGTRTTKPASYVQSRSSTPSPSKTPLSKTQLASKLLGELRDQVAEMNSNIKILGALFEDMSNLSSVSPGPIKRAEPVSFSSNDTIPPIEVSGASNVKLAQNGMSTTMVVTFTVVETLTIGFGAGVAPMTTTSTSLSSSSSSLLLTTSSSMPSSSMIPSSSMTPSSSSIVPSNSSMVSCNSAHMTTSSSMLPSSSSMVMSSSTIVPSSSSMFMNSSSSVMSSSPSASTSGSAGTTTAFAPQNANTAATLSFTTAFFSDFAASSFPTQTVPADANVVLPFDTPVPVLPREETFLSIGARLRSSSATSGASATSTPSPEDVIFPLDSSPTKEENHFTAPTPPPGDAFSFPFPAGTNPGTAEINPLPFVTKGGTWIYDPTSESWRWFPSNGSPPVDFPVLSF